MSLCTIAPTRALDCMEAASVHGSVTQGTCLSRGEDINEHAALQLNDKFGRAHCKAQDNGGEGLKEVPRTRLSLRPDLALISNITRAQIGSKTRGVEAPRKHALRQRGITILGRHMPPLWE